MQYYAAGRYKEAIPIARRALSIRERALGENPDTAVSLNNLAVLFDAIGDQARAEPLYRRSLAIREKTLGADHPDTATALNNLAFSYKTAGDYARAEPLYRRALAIREKRLGPDDPATASSVNNLAALYDATGEYDRAKPLYQRALSIRERKLNPDDLDIAISLNNIAALYYATGAYKDAEPLYQRALAIYEKARGPDDFDTVAPLNNLAALYRATGAYGKAQPLYDRALAITEKSRGPESLDTAAQLNNLGTLHFAIGDDKEAEALVLRALAILEKAPHSGHPYIPAFLSNLASIYEAAGDYAKAMPLYQRALAIREKMLGPNHPSTAVSLNNLAIIYREAGEYKRAKRLHERALSIREKALGPQHPDTGASLANLAVLYRATGDSAKALSLYRRAQKIFELNLARFLLSGDEVRKRAYLQQRAGDAYAEASFPLAYRRAKALGLTAVLQHKGRALDAMAESTAVLRRSVTPGVQAIFDELTSVAQQASILTFRGPGNLSIQAYRERLDALVHRQERLEEELSARSAKFRETATPITLRDVRRSLSTRSALLEYFRYQPFDPKATSEKVKWGASHYIAYVLKREGEPGAVDLGAVDDIDKLVSDFRVALKDPTSSSYKEVAAKLFERLIKPLQTYLSGVDRLLLSPDGALNLLPFAALMDERQDYLAQGFELTYLTSGRDLPKLATSEPARGSTVVLADPAYGPSTSGMPSDIGSYRSIDLDSSGLVFTPLPGTADEARALQKLLDLDAKAVFTGVDASEEKLKGLHSPRILHIATHGFFLSDRSAATASQPMTNVGGEATLMQPGENPLLRSGLALAGANARLSGAGDDGILTAAEAALLDLRGTQLVVLSACETGLGQVQQGEGVYGLRRALVLAGAEAQLVSLWKVADTQTRTLMEEYYGHILKGDGRSAALREAQEAMIAKPATRHPYYWAAFVLVGNGAPLAMKGPIVP